MRKIGIEMGSAPPALQLHAPPYIDDVWKHVVQDLMESGVALLRLQATTQQENAASVETVPTNAFASSAAALDLLGAANDPTTLCPVIADSTDSAHATGYHRAGSMSARYNAHREGFVFSDGHDITVVGCPNFATDCAALYNILHETADQVLAAVCRHLQLPGTWLQEQLGPTVNNSQWHVKRYVTTSSKACTVECLLPTHKDPSLISIVVLHRPGIQEGAAGLQYAGEDQIWMEVPWSGHPVAIVFTGSVLEHVTGGYITACRHRVVASAELERMAATLFVRPTPNAVLSMPPSPVLAGRSVKCNLTFKQWCTKTARNYEKAKGT